MIYLAVRRGFSISVIFQPNTNTKAVSSKNYIYYLIVNYYNFIIIILIISGMEVNNDFLIFWKYWF